MKKYLFTLLTLFGGISAASAQDQVQTQEVLQLALQEAVEFALENNVEAKNAKLEVLIAEGTIKERTSTGLPQINGSANLNYNPSIPVVFLPNTPPFGDPSIDSDVIPARFGVHYQSGVSLTVSQMIFDGSFFVGLKAAKVLKQLTAFDQEKTQNDVIENVKKAYFGVLVNEHRIRLAEANLARIDSLLTETNAMFEEGFAEKLDVSRIRVQKNNTYTQLERSKTAYEISKDVLKIQMGLPQAYDLVLTESLEELSPEGSLVQLLAQEEGRRVEVDQINTNLELVQLDIKNNVSQYLPSLDLNGNMQWSGAGNTLNTLYNSKNWFKSSLVGVTMTIPIFDGLGKSARIQKGRVQLRQLENQKYFLKENITLEIAQAKSTLQNDIKILQVQRENMDLAQEVFETTTIKYREGVGSNFEVVEADAALIEAEINFLSALYDALIAKVDLEKALGVLQPSSAQ